MLGLIPLPYRLALAAGALAAAYAGGRYHQHRVDVAEAAVARLEATQEARRIEQARARNQTEVVNAYLRAKAAAQARATAADARARSMRDGLAAARLAIDAASADGADGVDAAECGRLLGQGAGLVYRGAELAIEGEGLSDRLEAQAAALQSAVRGLQLKDPMK